MDIDRARLVQERWFTAARLLLIEACLAARLGADLQAFAEGRLGALILGFAAYSLLIALMVLFMRRWPIGLAYVTATVDTLAAVAVATVWSDGVVNPGLIGVAAAGVMAGVRRFPVFETFAYSFIIAVGMAVAGFILYERIPAELADRVAIVGVALLPVLTRAATLAPQQGGRDDPMGRLSGRGMAALASLPAGEGPGPAPVYHAAAAALAEYTDSPLAGVIVRAPDQSIDLYSAVDGKTIADHLPAQSEDQLVHRLLKISDVTVLGRRDDLHTRGLPDQYPPRLDSLLAAPVPNISDLGAALFAANRKGGAYRADDRLMAATLGREMARLALASTASATTAATRAAAMDALLAAVESRRPGARAWAEECARYATTIARELGLGEREVVELGLAAILRDVGELSAPDGLHERASQLTPDEVEAFKQHPRISARIIDAFNRSETVLNAIYSHHERWDGQGFPAGLAGEDIPLGGRILAVADAIELMTRPRPDGSAIAATDAVQEVIKASGSQFDPSIVQTFLSVLRQEGQTFLERAPETAAAPGQEWGRSRVS